MNNADTDMMFPFRIIPALGDLRGEEWQNLVHHLANDSVEISEKAAFTLFLTRLCGCVNCNADSFKAMRGCAQCARQIIKRYKNSDSDLIKSYQECHKEVRNYLAGRDSQL